MSYEKAKVLEDVLSAFRQTPIVCTCKFGTGNYMLVPLTGSFICLRPQCRALSSPNENVILSLSPNIKDDTKTVIEEYNNRPRTTATLVIGVKSTGLYYFTILNGII